MTRRSVCHLISIQHASKLSVVIVAALFPDACSHEWEPSPERHSRRVALFDGASLLQHSIDARESSPLGGHPKKRQKQAPRIARGGDQERYQSHAFNNTRPEGSQTFPSNNSKIEKRPPQLPVDHLENRTRRNAGPVSQNASNRSRNDTGPEPELQTPHAVGHAYANASQNASARSGRTPHDSGQASRDRAAARQSQGVGVDAGADVFLDPTRTSTTSTTTPDSGAVATYILYFGVSTTTQDICDFCHYLNLTAPTGKDRPPVPCLHYGDPDRKGLPIAIVHTAIVDFQPILAAHNYDLLWIEGDKEMKQMSDSDSDSDSAPPTLTTATQTLSKTYSMTTTETGTFTKTSLTTPTTTTKTTTRTSMTYTKTSLTTSTTTVTSTLTTTTSTTTSTTNTTTRTSTTGTTTTSTTTIVLTWSLDRIDDRYGFDGGFEDGDAGYGVHIYQFDTGVSWTHKEFSGRAISVMDMEYTATGPQKILCPKSSVKRSDKPAPPPDDHWAYDKNDHTEYGDVEHHRYNPFHDDDVVDDYFGPLGEDEPGRCGWDNDGHGTHTASIIMSRNYGVSKNSRLWMYKVGEYNRTAKKSMLTVAGFLQGLDHALVHQRNPSVVACLFSAQGRSGSMMRALEHTINGGTLVVVAAGSDRYPTEACEYFPADVPGALVVSSMDEFDNKDPRANYGECVDLYAPGTQITAAKAGGQLTTTKTGTSMAAAHGAGLAALMLSWYPSASPAYLKSAMVTMSMPNVLTGTVSGPNNMIYTHRARLFFEIAGTDAKISFMEWWARNMERTYDDALRLFLVVDEDHNMGIDFLEFNHSFGGFT